MIYLKGHFFSLTKMTIVIIWQFFLVSELNSCERRIFLVYFYCHMSTLRIKWETYITRDRHTLLVHCVENSLNFKMSYDIWKLTKCSSTYNHLFTVLSFLRKLITIPMGGKGLKEKIHIVYGNNYTPIISPFSFKHTSFLNPLTPRSNLSFSLLSTIQFL